MALGAVFMLSQGDIDLSVGSIYNITGILCFFLLQAGWPAILVVLVGLLAGILCGLINITLSIYLKIPMMIITLGTLNIYRGLGLVLYDARPKAVFDH